MALFKTKPIVEDENKSKIDLLMSVTNSKMTPKEVNRVYQILDAEVMKKIPRNMQIIEAMDKITELKGDWLTPTEKENFVAGVWMFDTLDTSKPQNKAYINEEQLKYVKEAVLGTQFKAARNSEYYAELREYQYKY